MQAIEKGLLFAGRYSLLALAGRLILIPLGFGLAMCTSAQIASQEAVPSSELAAASSSAVVPQQVRYSGKLATRAGDSVEAVFRIYPDAEGGDPLWTETQRITISEDGSYSVLLGGASQVGLPQTVFAGGAARWLGVSVERGQEQERVLLSSVPYAMKSADAESLAGHSVSDFVTQEQFAQLAQSVSQPAQQGGAAASITPLTSGAVTGSGTAGTIPLWTGTLTQGNSEIVQVGSDIGINEAIPGATLDVGGTATFRGTATLPAENTATASAGYRSQLLDFTDSAWSATTKAPVAQTWRLYATDSGNDSANPTSTFNFQFQNGAGASTPTILSIEQTGVIDFASAQTFPGTIKSVSGAGPLTATTASGAVSVGLDAAALEATLNSVYAQLGTSNSFAGEVRATQAIGANYAALNGNGTNGSMGVFGSSDTGYGVEGVSNSGPGVYGTSFGDGSAGYFQNNSTTNPALDGENDGQGNGVLGVSANGSGVIGKTHGGSSKGNAVGPTGSWGVWGDTGVAGQTTAGVLGTADDGFAGFFASNSADVPTIDVIQSGNNEAAQLESNSTGLPTLWVTNGGGSDAAEMDNYSNYPTLYLINGGSGGILNQVADAIVPDGGALFKTLMASTPTGTCGIGGDGDLSCTGQMKSLVSTSGAHKVETYAPQSAENWMEDYGTGAMERGVSVVKIDSAFAETISQSADYHVFITPRGDSKGLYVINATAAGFEVRESGGGTSSLTFDYKIVAKRRGYESQRLRDVTESFNAAKERAERKRKPESKPFVEREGHPNSSAALETPAH
jgi:hypothetical protein